MPSTCSQPPTKRLKSGGVMLAFLKELLWSHYNSVFPPSLCLPHLSICLSFCVLLSCLSVLAWVWSPPTLSWLPAPLTIFICLRSAISAPASHQLITSQYIYPSSPTTHCWVVVSAFMVVTLQAS